MSDPACASAQDPQHAWNRGSLWTLLFWFFLAFGLVLTLLLNDVSPARKAVTIAALSVIAAAHLVIRPGPGRTRFPGNAGYLMIVIVAAGVACAAQPSTSLLLTVFFPQIWLFGGAVRTCAYLSGALALATMLGQWAANGWSADSLWVLGTIMVISLVFSIGFGTWISRIIDQSRERAELIVELEAARSELGAERHAQGVMAERERMAREIHDTLAQGFTSVIMLAQSAQAQLSRSPLVTAQRLTSIEEVARENLAEARALVAAFAPVGLEGSTLVDAVARLTDRFAAETGLSVALDLPGGAALTGLSRDREVVLLRAVQESLTNVRRHARATSVRVRVWLSGDDAQVEVTDDGVGFGAASVAGFGLTGMRHRVSDAGGSVDVASTPGHGTRVLVRLPADLPS